MAEQKLEGRTALITGASKGIGRAIAYAFAQQGADVAATARTTSRLESLAEDVRALGRRALPITADLLHPTDVQRIADETLAEFSRIDILVNNAAIIHPRIPLTELDPQAWRDVIEVNITAAAMLTRAVLPSMIENGYGKIINISSIGGRKGGWGRSAYRVTKAGLISLTESVAAEVKQYGIDVNCICPSATDTEGYREAFNSRGIEDNPKMARPEQTAALAVFLASDDSAVVTGTAIDAFGATNPLFS